MRRLLSFVGTLMLLVLVFTGTTAHAAEAFGCIEVRADSAGHFDGDRDQVPADADKGVAHHHGGCGGHCVAVPATVDGAQTSSGDEAPPAFRARRGLPSLEPGRALRPPIA